MSAFKKGDRVVCVDAPHDFFGQLESNAEYTVSSVLGNGAVCIAGRPHLSFHPSRFRLSQPSAPLGEVYGTMPEVLPETLPVGTRSKHGSRALSELRLESRICGDGRPGFGYWGEWSTAQGEDLYNAPKSIDWSKIPRVQPDAKEGGPEVGETKAPNPLPEWLPVGTTWTANRGAPDEYTWVLHSRAHNDGGWIKGHEQWSVTGAYERIAPDREHFEGPCGNIELGEVNWPSYYAALRRISPAPTDATGGEAQKPDPYHKPEEAPPRWLAEQNAKHAALIAKHKADFDRVRTPANRKAAERLKAAVAETLKSWPERDGWEP